MSNNGFYGADDPLTLLGVYGAAPGRVAGADIVGAAGSPMMPMPLAAGAYGGGAAADPRQAAKFQHLSQLALARQVPQINLGVAATVNPVLAGAAFTSNANSGVPLRITLFTVPGSIAPFFSISEVKIARVDLIAGANAVPAEVFAPNAVTPPNEQPILPAGAPAVVSGQNVDTNPHNFVANFFGIDLTTEHGRMTL